MGRVGSRQQCEHDGIIVFNFMTKRHSFTEMKLKLKTKTPDQNTLMSVQCLQYN